MVAPPFSCAALRAMRRCSQHADTQVLIVGNGPAGLSLSAFLSGLTPYYNPHQPHPNGTVHGILSESNTSLIDQDLSWADNLEELGGSGRPLSVLYDSLVRPGADIGANAPSSLSWKFENEREIPHIVVGETPIGGSWNDYDPQMVAVSFSSWLDLPGFSVNEYLGGTPLVPRLPSVIIAAYMDAYAKKMGIKKNIRPNTRVTSIKKEGDHWVTRGKNADGRSFVITSRIVVLACGKTKSRTLGLPNESSCSNIVYDVPALKSRILQDMELGKDYTRAESSTSSRVVVVGDGISSADVVRHCLEKGIPVLHVMRRNDRQLRNILMSRLSPEHYSEYHWIYRLMTGRDHHALYERSSGSEITGIIDDFLIVKTPKEERKEPFGLAAVCVGRESDFQNVISEKNSFLGYRAENDDSLFAVGSFAGDHFVRYLVGGCLEVAKHINATYPKKSRCC